MNPRITDLLDDYVDTSVRLFPPEQVLGDTSSGKKKSPTPKPVHHRMKKPLVIAAALLLMVTGIAVAGLKLSNVGSTGASTGPHLDYRVWRNGKPIDPLKIPQEPGEPIHKANRAAYEYVRDRIMAELDGEVKEEDKIKQLDSIVLTPSKTTDSLVFSSKL